MVVNAMKRSSEYLIETNTEREAFANLFADGKFGLIHRYIFFDTEFQKIFKVFKELSDVINSIESRIKSKESPLVSDSKFKYIERKKERHLFPENQFCFVDGEEEIKIIRIKKFYYISSTFKGSLLKSWRGVPRLYGEYDLLGKAINDYHYTVKEYILRKYDELF